MLAVVQTSETLRPMKTRDRRSHAGRRLIEHERRLFDLIGGEDAASPAQRTAVADAAELALAAEKARAEYLSDQISATQLLRFQDAARDAERAIAEIAR